MENESVVSQNAQERTFKPGDKVFVILPIPGHLLRARFCGPYIVERKVNKVHYVVYISEYRKQRRLLCHINMLKKYYVDCSTPSVPHTPLTVAIISNIPHGEIATQDGEGPIEKVL